MKVNHIIKAAAVMAVGVLSLTSCEDFLTIYPTDKTVAEDFWKKKSDVEEMVTGAYKAVIAGGVQERAIMWGSFRSDEVVKNSSYSNTEFENISIVNLLPTQGLCKWGDFYSVINRCNIVLHHAPDVVEADPDFTDGDYQTLRAQMLALRSFCYFYLVRTFRDVPYTEVAHETDDDEMAVAQSAPGEVLQKCIDDLLEAEKSALKSGAYGDYNWRNVGYFTRDAIHALLADIYLWRGSMLHSADDYQKCVQYADMVIQAKDEYYRKLHPNEIDPELRDDIYHLFSATEQFLYVFGYGANSRESILEWQYDGNNNANTTLENYYYRNSENDSYSRLMASRIFNTVADNANILSAQKAFFSKNDYRFWNFVSLVNNEEANELPIRKMVDNYYEIIPVTANIGAPKPVRAYNNYRQNWIVYRISDVMLMKAEALVQLAVGNDENTLKNAFNLVQTVNKRSMLRLATDTLKFEGYNSQSSMELLVLAERERELCFEGKRWYDLLRYTYRHMDNVNIYQLMGDEDYSAPTLYSPMVGFLTRKFQNGGQSVSYKMKTEPFLYWPINENELKVNSLLRQNPVFEQESSISKK